jgi:PAS domain S-box-containing protein
VNDDLYRPFFIDNASAVLFAGPEGEVLDANAAACRLLGRSREELLGEGIGGVFDASDPRLGAAREQWRREGGFRGELRVLRRVGADEEPFEALVTVADSRDRTGGERFVIAIKDSKERERSDVSVERWFYSLTRYTTDVMQVFEADGSLRYVSPSVEQILGYKPEELIGTIALNTLHPEEFERVVTEFTGIWLTPGVSPPVELRIRHKNGSYLHVEAIANNLLEDPNVRGVVLVFRDVTGRVQAEQQIRSMNETLERRVAERAERLEELAAELEKSQENYRAIFENAVEGIFQTTADGRFITANPAMARILGYASPEEMISSVTDVEHQFYDDPSSREELYAALGREGSISGHELRMARRDGSPVWVSASARILYDEAGEPAGFEGAVHDITERVEARRTLERRLASLTRMSASLTVDQPVEALFDSLASDVVEDTAALACSVVLIDPATGALSVAGSHGLPDGYTEAMQAAWRAGARSPVAASFESLRPELVRNGRRSLLDDALSAPLHHLLRKVPWEHIYTVPLVARGEALGAIVLYYPPAEEPREDEMAFLGAVSDQAAVAVENARFSIAAQGAAVLQERQRISRELHDSVSQALYGIALGSHTARTLLDVDPERVAEPLEYVLSLAEAGLAEMRALIFELRPEALESEGLAAALEKQAAALRARHGIFVTTDLCDDPGLPVETKEALYRIVQEAIQNTVKHSGATSVRLSLKRLSRGISLEVRDDGAGFDPSGSFPGHLGLRSMRERAARLGGTLEVESITGEGTSVRAWIPI